MASIIIVDFVSVAFHIHDTYTTLFTSANNRQGRRNVIPRMSFRINGARARGDVVTLHCIVEKSEIENSPVNACLDATFKRVER